MQSRGKLWPVVTIRVFAVLNLLLGVEGLAALLDIVAKTLGHGPRPQAQPFYAQAFYLRSLVNLVFVVLTILAGVNLFHLSRRGWSMCKVLFGGEIAYFFLDWLNFPLLLAFGQKASRVCDALGASAGTGNMGTALQTITGYPVIALIALKIAFGRLQRSRARAGSDAQ
jgi:hypothetical protein